MKIFLITLVLLLFFPLNVLAYSQEEFDVNFNEWNEKRELASRLLLDAEESFKMGDELNGCVSQHKASQYGIEATQALIRAMKLSRTENGLEDLQIGLNKWRELGESC